MIGAVSARMAVARLLISLRTSRRRWRRGRAFPCAPMWISAISNTCENWLTFARRAGQVVGYAELLTAVWGYQEPGDDRRLIKSCVRRLRDRLGDPAAAYLVSVRGVGYMLREP